jgi:THO complex subunit 6
LQEVLSPGNEKTPKFRTPSLNFFTSKDEMPIYSMATTEDFLIVGTVGEIIGYHWETIITMKNPAISWKITIPSNK